MKLSVLATILALTGAASADPQNNCGDPRLAKVRHFPVKLVSKQTNVKVDIEWNMKIAGHEDCGTVDVPWQGSLPRGAYNLVVYVGSEVVAQVRMSLGSTAELHVVDVTPKH